MSTSFAIVALALVVSLAAGYTDVRWARIPNALTYPAILAGLGLQTGIHGGRGLLLSFAGGVLMGGVFLLLYVVRTMGAGDVKLAAALGCIVGLPASVQLIFAIAIAGGIFGVLQALYTRRAGEVLRNSISLIGFHSRFGLQPHPVLNLENSGAARMPYAVAAAGGTLFWAVFLT